MIQDLRYFLFNRIKDNFKNILKRLYLNFKNQVYHSIEVDMVDKFNLKARYFVFYNPFVNQICTTLKSKIRNKPQIKINKRLSYMVFSQVMFLELAEAALFPEAFNFEVSHVV